MPSLRRTLSSPAVRSSPYPTSLSEQAAMLRSQGTGGHRRSTGSESIGRRVLADIEWWRVVDGQCLVSPDHDDEDVGRDERDTEQVPLHVAADRVQPPQYSEVDRSFVPFTWNPSLTEPSEVCVKPCPRFLYASRLMRHCRPYYQWCPRRRLARDTVGIRRRRRWNRRPNCPKPPLKACAWTSSTSTWAPGMPTRSFPRTRREDVPGAERCRPTLPFAPRHLRTFLPSKAISKRCTPTSRCPRFHRAPRPSSTEAAHPIITQLAETLPKFCTPASPPYLISSHVAKLFTAFAIHSHTCICTISIVTPNPHYSCYSSASSPVNEHP